MVRNGLLVVFGVFLAAVVGCQTAESDFQGGRDAASQAHLAGGYWPRQSPQRQLAWQQTLREGTLQAYQRFASEDPNSRYADEARWHAESLEWSQAVQSGSLAQVVGYVAHHPDGRHAEKARELARLMLMQANAEKLPPTSLLNPKVAPEVQPYVQSERLVEFSPGVVARSDLALVYLDGAWYRLRE